MTSGAEKLWIKPVHGDRPSAVLCRARFCLNEAQSDKFLSAALAGRIAEVIGLEASLFTVACRKAFVGVPEPSIFTCVSIGEMTKYQEEVTLRMREGFLQFFVIEYGMWCEEKV